MDEGGVRRHVRAIAACQGSESRACVHSQIDVQALGGTLGQRYEPKCRSQYIMGTRCEHAGGIIQMRYHNTVPNVFQASRLNQSDSRYIHLA